MKNKLLSTLNFVIFLSFTLIFTGCSPTVFSSSGSSSFSSETPIDTNEPLPLNIPIHFPSYAKINNLVLLGIQSELFFNIQGDMVSCAVSFLNKPIGSNEALCSDIPDLCWSDSITTVSKYEDYTCARAYKAIEIYRLRENQSCTEQEFPLTESELNSIQNASLYKTSDTLPTTTTNEFNIQSFATNSIPTTTTNEFNIQSFATNSIPTIKTIKLDSYCGCNYLGNNSNSEVAYKLPAFQEHCQKYFSDVYQ